MIPENPMSRLLRALLLGLAACATANEAAAQEESGPIEFFEKKIRPLLATNCYNCHSAFNNSMGGLRVDDRHGLLTGGNRGPAIVPGQPEKSRLIAAVRHPEQGLKMPPNKKLTDAEIADLEKWIADGAPWPEVKLPESIGSRAAEYEQLKKTHWSWQPLSAVAIPAVQQVDWPRSDIDKFVLQKLEAANLQPVTDAKPLALIRRVTFDLTGLPPSPEEIDEFVEDEAPNALEKLVDRLLASKSFGERWGRHWLDVARFGESTGSARNLPYPHAWRYRDWVIDAVNNDKPYHQFLREQIAGDLLPANSPREKANQLIATGFLAIGVKDVNQRFKVRYIMDNVDEQIDVVTRGILGLSASCARCHDHKFDPIPTHDYYALAGIFRSTDLCAGLRNKMGGGGLDYYDSELLIPLSDSAVDTDADADAKIAKLQEELKVAVAEFQALRNSPEGDVKTADGRPKRMVARLKTEKIRADINALNDPAARGPVAMGVRDAVAVADTEIRVRGEAEKLGPVVPRGFLSVLTLPDQSAVNKKQSGRLELADWLTHPQNPLTSRVIVNRIWQHLLGRGIVGSVDNFGVTGDVPTHPELLDYLAARFIREGWSIKKLVREIVLSRTYALSSAETPAHRTADPGNRLLWRHTPRRLDAEEIRDAILATGGTLDRARPTGSPIQKYPVIELRNNGPQARSIANQAQSSRHRSVYLPLLRTLTPRALDVFDPAEQGFVSGSRDTTTVAPQALYLLNDPFILEQAHKLADRVLQRQDLDEHHRVVWAYRLALGRTPATPEVSRALTYLNETVGAQRQLLAAAEPGASAKPAATVAANSTDETAQGTTANAPTGNGTTGATPAPPPATPTGGAATAAPRPAPARPAPTVPVNPDDPVPEDDAPVEKSHQPTDPRVAAWVSFCQALLGSAEFRYLR
ncbi:MAG: PSD1 domain-containing protein [Planctomycetes bacterium]|nr:PSD1 domain-containing protein [Planctomycetota bacterium]